MAKRLIDSGVVETKEQIEYGDRQKKYIKGKIDSHMRQRLEQHQANTVFAPVPCKYCGDQKRNASVACLNCFATSDGAVGHNILTGAVVMPVSLKPEEHPADPRDVEY